MFDLGTSIYQLKGEDPERGPVTYSLQGTSQLVVDAKTGVVTVAKPLDYEVSYSLNEFFKKMTAMTWKRDLSRLSALIFDIRNAH